MVDAGRVRDLLEMLRAYRDRLAALRELPIERYLADEAFAGRYLIQAAGQICIDVANHLISSEGWRTPQERRSRAGEDGAGTGRPVRVISPVSST